jgi:hypothetical protein
MQKLNLTNSIQSFDYKTLFIDELGWNNPTTPSPITKTDYQAKPTNEPKFTNKSPTSPTKTYSFSLINAQSPQKVSGIG